MQNNTGVQNSILSYMRTTPLKYYHLGSLVMPQTRSDNKNRIASNPNQIGDDIMK
jgi:hypothetical protein